MNKWMDHLMILPRLKFNYCERMYQIWVRVTKQLFIKYMTNLSKYPKKWRGYFLKYNISKIKIGNDSLQNTWQKWHIPRSLLKNEKLGSIYIDVKFNWKVWNLPH